MQALGIKGGDGTLPGVLIEPIDETGLPVGVRQIAIPTMVDEVGRVLPLYDPSWAGHTDPLVYSHVFTILPGRAKGWGLHERHDDRYALLMGSIEIALCDARSDSPTHGLGVKLTIHESSRKLVVIPRGVWHATRNIGSQEAMIVDFPTEPYDHRTPDKITLPLDTDDLMMKLGPEWIGF